MDRIKFMIDSGSDIPPEVADALDAEVVPLYRVIDGVPVLDYHDFNIQEYSEYLKTCKEIPTTSQPSPEDFLTRYERFADEGYDHIICITMSVHVPAPTTVLCLPVKCSRSAIPNLQCRSMWWIPGAVRSTW